jgi:hypothetical protein
VVVTVVNFPIQKVGAKPNVLPNWTVKKKSQNLGVIQ